MKPIPPYYGPIHIWSNAAVRVRSSRTNDDCFRVTTDGARGEIYHDGGHYILSGCTALHLIAGADHILVSEEFRRVLQDCCRDCVSFCPAVLTDSLTGNPLTTYCVLRACDELKRPALKSFDCSGAHAWHFKQRHLFITEVVMVEIKKACLLGLIFAPGFSDFLE